MMGCQGDRGRPSRSPDALIASRLRKGPPTIPETTSSCLQGCNKLQTQAPPPKLYPVPAALQDDKRFLEAEAAQLVAFAAKLQHQSVELATRDAQLEGSQVRRRRKLAV